MTSFISNIIWNSVEGFVDAGKKSAGEFGGNALIKAGDMIENSGRNIGTGKFDTFFAPLPEPSRIHMECYTLNFS